MSNTQTTHRSRKPFSRLLVVAAIAAPALAGCAPDRVTRSPPMPSDYRARHPIVLTQAPITTDILATSRGLDTRGREQVRAFAKEYRLAGGGNITVQAPTGNHNTHAVIDGIRRELAASGVRSGIFVSSYQPADPMLASPIRLSYLGAKAMVRSRCGEWPRDLASGSSIEGWENQPYWNHGCAYQQAFASQVADPRDLAGPRAEGTSDVAMRIRAIGKVREGEDPGTEWKVENTSIGTVGAN
ncbi:MAG: CpaD family pilus assembly protein [Beijerinckiaceae bacterium]|nr:CpaD family pilus assembly protein [Beijerinckiaceae bacterium]